MRTLSIFVIFLFILLSCSSGSKAVTNKKVSKVNYETYENPFYKKKSKSGSIVASPDIDKKVNAIIEGKTGQTLSEIARSDVYKTKSGYEWKFSNVTTGESFQVVTDRNFKAVKFIRIDNLSK